MKEIVIIGGGSSGVLAAIFAKNDNNKVTILERNSTLLKKLLMTGNGKCNYYNDDQDIKNYHSQNTDILKQIITKKNTDAVINYFNSLGVVSKVKNGYYYPFSNQAVTIKNVLENEINRLGINVIYNALVEDISIILSFLIDNLIILYVISLSLSLSLGDNNETRSTASTNSSLLNLIIIGNSLGINLDVGG